MPKLKDVILSEISFVDKGDNKGAHVILTKRKTNIKRGKVMTKEQLKALKKKLDATELKHFEALEKIESERDSLKSDLEKLESDHETLVAKVADLEKNKDSDKDDVIDKSKLSDDVKKILDDQETELKKQADKIAKMEAENLRKNYTLKLTKDASLVGDVDDIAGLLIKCSPDVAESLVKIMAGANARIEKGELFRENGTSTVVAKATDAINKKAQEYADEKNISFQKAWSHIYKTNKTLRDAYLEETRN